MNETKRNFLLEKEQQEVFETLTDEEAGKLIKGIFRYLNTGDSGLTGMMNAIFIPIKKSIDKNEENYKKICERNRENIKKRWNKKYESIPSDTNVYESVPKDTDTRHISYITNHNSYLGKDKGVIGEEEKPFVASDDSLLLETTKQILNHLNKKTGANYRHTTKSTRNKINARLNEGYVLDDFIEVIDKKCVEWMNTDMQKYLRPETLFGTKFEGYLNQPAKKLTTKDIPIDISDF